MALRWDEVLLGKAKDPTDPRIFHSLSLVALLAWVGLGADGLSSSCYGPEEAYRALGAHHYLALPLAAFMVLTIVVLSASYSLLIEQFPGGGGGYAVSSQTLGRAAALVCGCALIVDYILTIAISLVSGVDAVFSLLPVDYGGYKILASVAAVLLLLFLNLRGVRESILVLVPIFVLFLVTHVLVILIAVFGHVGSLGQTVTTSYREAAGAAGPLGFGAMLLLLCRAYSLGGGTYTGLEAVSNSMGLLREPRVTTAKTTMMYMAVSLSLTAAGLFLGYLLLGVAPIAGRTLNAVLVERVLGDGAFGRALGALTLISEGAILFVAAQTGFAAGPRSMAVMAVDRWLPARFAQLSNRLVVQDGVLFMAGAALLFVLGTGAHVSVLVVLYSVGVFITFLLAQLGMCVLWLRQRKTVADWRRRLAVNGLGLGLTVVILTMTVWIKYHEGAWASLLAVGIGIAFCLLVRRHYRAVQVKLARLEDLVRKPPTGDVAPVAADPNAPTAVLMLSGYNGAGMHLLLTIQRLFPGHFRNFVFLSVATVDFDAFRGVEEVRRLRQATELSMQRYLPTAWAMGGHAEYACAVGADVIEQIEPLCLEAAKKYPRSVFFVGHLIFAKESVWTRLLHSNLTVEVQRRLSFQGCPVVTLPIRLLE